MSDTSAPEAKPAPASNRGQLISTTVAAQLLMLDPERNPLLQDGDVGLDVSNGFHCISPRAVRTGCRRLDRPASVSQRQPVSTR